jgi:plasmid stabilization system protein ParE
VALIVTSAAARAELIVARDWYSVHGAELTARFTAEVETVVERLVTAPYQFLVVYRDVRRARWRRLPYTLFFRIVDGTVHVIACFHSSRDPCQWQRR